MVGRAEDSMSELNSVEFADAVVDESFFTTKGHTQGYDSENESSNSGLLARIWQFYTDKSLLRRLEEHQTEELKVFIAQKLFKLDGILCSEETRLGLIDVVLLRSKATTDENLLELKYGCQVTQWMQDRLFPSVADCSSILRAATKELAQLKQAERCPDSVDSPELEDPPTVGCADSGCSDSTYFGLALPVTFFL